MHEANACDENGCAATGIIQSACRRSRSIYLEIVLTCKPAFFLFSASRGREWGTWAFIVRRQSNIARLAEGIQGL